MKKKTEKSNRKKNKILIIIGILVVMAGLLAIILILRQNNSSSGGLAFDDFYSDEQCRCLEHELNDCSNGFELKENVCINETLKVYTNVIKKCSKYECSGIVYEFNSDINGWQSK